MLQVEGIFGLLQQDIAAQIAPLLSSRMLAVAALALATAAVSTLLAVPLACRLTAASRGWRGFWLLVLMVVLSFSEAVLGLVATPFTDLEAASGLPSLSGTAMAMAGMTVRALPFTILVLYPSLRQIDRSLIEAARTMGATSTRVLSSVVAPLSRNAIGAAALLAFVFALGSFLLPRPHEPGQPATAAIAALVVLAALSLAAMLVLARGASNPD